MLQGFFQLFAVVTPEEGFAKGAKCVDDMLAKSLDRHATVQHLFKMADDGFSETKYEDQYDRGIVARLLELGHSREILAVEPGKEVDVPSQTALAETVSGNCNLGLAT